ncbi:hypothetical protein [Caldimonas brevitalea]|uniref:Uncharacterized protein n=1 Tax=Caldimonas brevitalea TaxID=413882 RepID=A0A0G3BUA2_9BURK|nr:hypothetical protein [Caldimonas brevitalea]AKJ30110.1 hypothetical protein AAW51_3419 [Caldimonas brevitalea]
MSPEKEEVPRGGQADGRAPTYSKRLRYLAGIADFDVGGLIFLSGRFSILF